MANIASYATSSPIIATDKWVGSSGNDGSTKNFLASDVSAFINPKDIITTALTVYTFQANTENVTLVYATNSPATFTIPLNATTAFTIGCTILVCNQGNDTITVSPTGGVTLYGTATITTGESKTLKKTDTDTWSIF